MDVDFLGTVLDLRITGSVNNNLLNELMHGNFSIPLYNGEEPFYVCAFAFLYLDFITEGSSYILKMMLLFLIVSREPSKSLFY